MRNESLYSTWTAGCHLRNLRKRVGLRLKDVADAMGVPISRVHYIEQQDRVTDKTIARYRTAVGKRLAKLFRGPVAF